MTRTHRDLVHLVLGIVVLIGFFVVLSIMLTRDKPGADILIGALSAAFGSVVGYYYGSSSGSRDKTDLLAQAQPVEPPT